MKKINVEFDTNAEKLREEASIMKTAAEKDSLTNLYNHNSFYERLNERIDKIKPQEKLHLIVVDIDNFKSINDTYGHIAGDKVIIHLSNVIKKTLNKFDFASRYGGEEFVGVYNNISENEVIDIANKIKDECKNAIIKYELLGDKLFEIRYTVSIGVTSYIKDVKSGTEMFEYADKGLYEAKQTGKNKVIFNKVKA